MAHRLDHNAAAPAGMAALGGVYGYVATCGLPKALIDLVYLRVSQINGCAFCIDMHGSALLEGGMPATTILLVQAWREAGALFDGRTQAALAWAECMTDVARTHAPDAAYEAAAAAFSEKELADLTIAIGLINAYNRLAIGFRAAPASAARKA
jgi:AhpD family alkylhydroperoxidase